MAMKNNAKADRNNLAIIGASGTGKTTLAVGLYATSTESFTVSPIGDETRKYLEIRKTSIEEGFWPEASLESVNLDLRLRLHASGNQTDIVFREYMGERMERDPNYIREVIGTPKSAMILFNPGMPGLSNPEARNRMLGNLKVIAQHLKDNKCIAVAFVVTASDRLTSDLEAFKADFEAYASEVTNHLTNLGLEWKRFDVTVSGQLDDQNKPKLARGDNNTTHEPFLWLLKRIRDFNLRKRIAAVAATVGILLGISGATFGGLVLHSRHKLADAETVFSNMVDMMKGAYSTNDMATVRTLSGCLKDLMPYYLDNLNVILPADQIRKSKLADQFNDQKDIWDVRLLDMELASTAKMLETKPLNVRLEWFEDFSKRLVASSPVFRDAVNERDALTNKWFNLRIGLEKSCQEKHLRNTIDTECKNLYSQKPDALSEPLKTTKELIADDAKYALVANRAELYASLGLMVARTNAICRYVDSKMGKPEDENPPPDIMTFCQQISNALKKALTSEEFDNLPGIIEQRHNVARMEWEAYQFPLRARKQLDELKAVSATPAGVLTSSRAFLDGIEEMFASIPEDKRMSIKKSIMDERDAAIGRYLDGKTKWKPEDEDPPGDTSVLQQQAREDFKSALTDDEFKSLEGKLAKRCDDARSAWEAHQFPLRAQKQLAELKAVSAAPANALRSSRGFMETMDKVFASIPEDKRMSITKSIMAERDAAISRYLDCKTNWKPEDEDPPGDTSVLQQQTRQELKSALTDEEFRSLEDKLVKRSGDARKAWDAFHFPRKVTELESALKSAGANPSRPLADSLAFLGIMTNNYPTIPRVEFVKAQNSICDARRAAIVAYEDSIIKKWNVNGSKPPEFDAKKIRDTILTQVAVTDAEYQAFEEEMNASFSKTKQDWDGKQRMLVEDFSVEGDPERIIRDYAEFFDDHVHNPYLVGLTAKVDQALQKYFRAFIADYYVRNDMNETQRRFNKFKRICAAIGGKGMKGNPILSSPSGKFALLCCNRGKVNDETRGIYSVFDQKIQITRIEAKVSISGCSDNYKGLDMAVKIGNLRWDFDQKDFVPVSSRPVIAMKESRNSNGYGRIPKYSNDSWQTIWSGSPEEISFGPYTEPFIVASYEDRLNGMFSGDVSDSEAYLLDIFSKVSSTKDLPDTRIYLCHDVYDNTVGTLQLRVTGLRVGDNYHDLARESGLIR